VKLTNSSPSSVEVISSGAIPPLSIDLHGVVHMGNFSFDEGMHTKCICIYLNMDNGEKKVDVRVTYVVMNCANLMKEKIKYTKGDCGCCP
jgi:hypothetical protein